MPEKLQLPPSGRLDARDEFGFLDEGEMTLREFCEVHGLPYPPAKEKFHLRPARPDEAGLFYAQPPGEDERLGTVGHLQMDFGRGGKEFWRIWWPSDVKEGNYPAFQTERPFCDGALPPQARREDQRRRDAGLWLYRGNGALPLLPAMLSLFR